MMEKDRQQMRAAALAFMTVVVLMATVITLIAWAESSRTLVEQIAREWSLLMNLARRIW